MKKYVIGLMGTASVGKTTSLHELAKRLLCQDKTQDQISAIQLFFNSLITRNNTRKDFRMVIRMGRYNVYIATPGDTLSLVSDNIKFFDGNLNCQRGNGIYIADAKTGIIARAKGNEYAQYIPTFCISACRTGANFLKKLDSFATTSTLTKCMFFYQCEINQLADAAIKTAIDLLPKK